MADDNNENNENENGNEQRAREYFDSGYEKGRAGDYKGAIEDFNKAIELKPDYTIAYDNRGYANSRLENYLQALADYDKAIKLDPN
ncbi:MAG: tetratricopeptide repeat protein, partial [Alphaproteobacteria bacterium]|nr:tetratricopeptide repeat protein [Alphaproteobacteria bacterium]